jgi:hypothetical protein
MNDKASQLVHEIGGLILESISETADAWTLALARFEFLDGATKENFAYLSESGDATFFRPSLDDEILDKVNSLREETRLNDESWIVCLIRVSPSGQVKISFEYTDSDKWAPQSFQHLDFS